jgi:hypothetical protein
VRGSTEGDGNQNFGASCQAAAGYSHMLASALKNAPYAGPLRKDMGALAIGDTLSYPQISLHAGAIIF